MGKKIEAIDGLFDGSDYCIENGCTCHVTWKKDGEKSIQQNTLLLYGVVVLKAELTFDNGIDIEKQVELDFLNMKGETLNVRIPFRDITNGNYRNYFGIEFRTAVGQRINALIIDSILSQQKRAKRSKIFLQTGYRDGMFLHAGGAIGADGVMVEPPGRCSNYFFPDSDSPGKSETVKKFLDLAPRSVTLPLLAIAFLSPLNEAFRRAGYEPSFLIMLLGVTGSMKSTLAALALNFFGENWNNKNLPHSFKDTANALEKSLFQLADVLTVIDDLHPAGSRLEAAKMAATFQAVSRSVGDRIGRQRMNPDSSLRQSYAPRGNVIITGEDFPNIGQSGTARNIVIELKKGDVDITTLSEVQAHTVHLAETMRGYIQWLLDTTNFPKC